MTREEREQVVKILDDIKVKIAIPKAAKTQNERNWALDMAIEALKQGACEDCISREAVFDWLCEGCERYHWNGDNVCLTKCEDYRTIAKLPPVQPKQGTIIHSKWIGDKDYPICVNCGCNVYEEYIACSDYAHIYKPMKYCPRCGATMNKENKE